MRTSQAFWLFAPLTIGLALALLATGCSPAPALEAATAASAADTGTSAGPSPATLLPITDNFHAIVPGVAYRSATVDAATLRWVVATYGIQTVVNLRGENPGQAWYDDEQAVASELGITLVSATWSAAQLPTTDELLKVYDTFQSASYPILIHCKSGSDRTGAAAAIWRMEINHDPRPVAARELSPAYGHFAAIYPAMDELVAMFQSDRNWILNEYPGP